MAWQTREEISSCPVAAIFMSCQHVHELQRTCANEHRACAAEAAIEAQVLKALQS